jgi:hypothetical protein
VEGRADQRPVLALPNQEEAPPQGRDVR